MNLLKVIALGFACLLAAAFAASGCGSSEGEATGGSTVALTKAEFIKHGDLICKKMDDTQNKQLQAYSAKHPGSRSSPEGEEKLLAVAGLPPIRIEAEELDALGAPSGEEQQVEAIMTALEKAIDSVERDPLSITASGGENPFTKPDELAGDYGFKECNFFY